MKSDMLLDSSTNNLDQTEISTSKYVGKMSKTVKTLFHFILNAKKMEWE